MYYDEVCYDRSCDGFDEMNDISRLNFKGYRCFSKLKLMYINFYNQRQSIAFSEIFVIVRVCYDDYCDIDVLLSEL